MFTASTAITRLAGGFVSAFPAEATPGADTAKRLQRLNEALDRIFEMGTWRGVYAKVNSLTTTAGVLTLDAAYLKLEKLWIPAWNVEIPVKTVEWQFQPGGIGVQDMTKFYGSRVAIDLGDNGSGVRQYQISGATADTDALTLTGLARKRFTWITETSTIVVPDSFQALRLAVMALNAEDRSDDARYEFLFGKALQVLSSNVTEFEPTDLGVVQIDSYVGLGSVTSLV